MTVERTTWGARFLRGDGELLGEFTNLRTLGDCFVACQAAIAFDDMTDIAQWYAAEDARAMSEQAEASK